MNIQRYSDLKYIFKRLVKESCYWILKIFLNSSSNIFFSLAPIRPKTLSFREQENKIQKNLSKNQMSKSK